ncbi:hypothetical protein RO3G_13669 [Rhizopus delemar RA 99-880]|uniref:Uncharacterized protein n=1 Tax=Rhizopus delemar (strain RA 99-880 / ATCC MYA-4621 / FGSC 9543 / NRRL 43880) TaxID=246409 RepID=I1CKH8_RHIO9|nr:hypothetical protein RO3G_13669 [Rhizopus delemar RA 99-880]|eukprot:EIE88958.1 hypothetical protein RO3G_13669 [Rhizopus delemar RA 99-880]
MQNLLDISKRLKEQELRDESIEDQTLPKEILDDLETTPKSVLREKLKKIAKDASKYEGEK